MMITVIIPCYRSENTIGQVVDDVKREIMVRKDNKYQIILVNDCSPDNTFAVIEKLTSEDKISSELIWLRIMVRIEPGWRPFHI